MSLYWEVESYHWATRSVPCCLGFWVQQVPKGPGTTRATDPGTPSSLIELSGSFCEAVCTLHFQNGAELAGRVGVQPSL